MADWRSSMQQTFEYYTVDPGTWKDNQRLDNVKSCTISRDADVETLGSATIDVTESIGESYVRIYLVVIQNGVKERYPLGTFLVQTPSSSFDGKTRTVTMDAYTPLLELKENPPPIGYSLFKNDNIMESAYRLIRENARAPVAETASSETLNYDFVANTDDTWLTFITDLIANAKHTLDLDELGRILFAPKQEVESLQPVWTYDDGNSSILYPELSMEHDIYGIPNKVEIVYSNGGDSYYAEAVNNDPNSPISTVNRGRVIKRQIVNPDLNGAVDENIIKEYAEQVLKELSSVEYTISYTHGYCPVRVGDCVRLNYSRADLKGIKAKVISQSIECKTGCKVTERAVFTTKLWG